LRGNGRGQSRIQVNRRWKRPFDHLEERTGVVIHVEISAGFGWIAAFACGVSEW
jgi:hypothetical protein